MAARRRFGGIMISEKMCQWRGGGSRKLGRSEVEHQLALPRGKSSTGGPVQEESTSHTSSGSFKITATMTCLTYLAASRSPPCQFPMRESTS